jgi:hypothetical protein
MTFGVNGGIPSRIRLIDEFGLASGAFRLAYQFF